MYRTYRLSTLTGWRACNVAPYCWYLSDSARHHVIGLLRRQGAVMASLLLVAILTDIVLVHVTFFDDGTL